MRAGQSVLGCRVMTRFIRSSAVPSCDGDDGGGGAETSTSWATLAY